MSRQKPDYNRSDRVHHIHEALNGNGKIADKNNASTFGKALGVEPKTIHLDVAWMLKHRFPIAYDRVEHCYYYTTDDHHFAELELNEAQILALAFSGNFKQALRGTAHYDAFSSAFAKLQASLQKRINIDLSQLDAYVSLSAAGQERNPDPEIARRIRRSIMNQREITFLYRKPDGTEKMRTVEPHHARQVDGLWYLLCYDPGHNDLITYMQKRMSAVELTGERFIRRYTCDEIHGKFRHSLGIHTGGTPEMVTLRFTGYAAEYVPMKTWHHSEQFTTNADGSVDLTVHLAINQEVTRFVLQWGSEVEVLGPPALIEADDAHAERKWNKILARRARVAAAAAAAV